MHYPAANTPSDDHGISRRLDATPLTYLHILIVFGTGLGLIFDTLEAAMTNVLATVFATHPGVERADLTMLLVAVFAGGAIGAPLAGRIADRVGRRASLLIALIGYAGASIAAAFAEGLGQLTVLRFIGGMFLAAYPPLMWTYLADVMPPKSRGKMMMICGGAGSLGSSLAPLLSRWLDVSQPFGFEGWQATFAVGGLGGLLVAMLTLRLPESPRWLASRGRIQASGAQLRRFETSRPLGDPARVSAEPAPVESHETLAPAGQAGRGPDFAKRLTLVMVLQFFQPLAVIGFAALSGVVLAKKGYDTHSSLLYVGVASLGAPLGALLASFVIDRLPRHVMFTICGIVMAILGLGFGLSSSPAAAMGIGMVYMIFIVLFTMTFNIYVSEMFVTEVRGVASGAAYAANRVGAMMVPLLLLPLLLETGATVMFSAIAATLLLSVSLVWLFGPRDLAGRALH